MRVSGPSSPVGPGGTPGFTLGIIGPLGGRGTLKPMNWNGLPARVSGPIPLRANVLWLEYAGKGWEGNRLQKRKSASRIRHRCEKIPAKGGSKCSKLVTTGKGFSMIGGRASLSKYARCWVCEMRLTACLIERVYRLLARLANRRFL